MYSIGMNYMGQTLEQLLVDYGGREVSAIDVYSDIFDLGGGLIQSTGESCTSKPNPIILGSWNDKRQRQIMLEDTFEEQLEYFQTADWAILNGLTYWGRQNKGNNQGQLCAFMIDYDGITPENLNNFLHASFANVYDGRGHYPIPNYVILSGNNVHLYYVLEAPITLYPKAKYELKKLKYGLTHRIWNRYTSSIEKPQYQGINQGFRIIGGKTKNNGIVKAYQLNTHPFNIDQLNEYVLEEERADVIEVVNPTRKYTLAEAKQKFPEWYQSVIVKKLPKRTWKCNESLYRWWLNKLWSDGNVSYGHRYFCIMALAIYAAKCGILDKERVKKDAMDLMGIFNTIKPDKPFTEEDIDSALECLDLRYCTFPRKDIEKITSISIPINKRNGRKQAQHVQIMTATRDIIYPNKEWINYNGRPKGSQNKSHPKKDLINQYKQEHPKATQREIAKALNVSPATVNKWLNHH